MTDITVHDLEAYRRTRRLSLAAFFALALAVLVFGQSRSAPETPLHEALEMAGIFLIVIGIVGRLWSKLYLEGRSSQPVVTDGPYSISRNPLYFFSAVAAIGIGAQMGAIASAIGLGFACALAFHAVILREEKVLLSKLGAPYREYLTKAPRFVPNLSLYREDGAIGFRPANLLTTLLDGLAFLVAMPLVELVDVLKQTGTLPVLFRLP